MRALAKVMVLMLLLAACAPAKLDGTELGAVPAPDFTLTDLLTGTDLALSSLRPQVVVLSFLLYGIGAIDNGTAVVPHNDAFYLLDGQGRERLLMHSSAPSETAGEQPAELAEGVNGGGPMPDLKAGMAGWMMPEAPEAPLAIVQRRYARGDVGVEEYERIRATFTKG